MESSRYVRVQDRLETEGGGRAGGDLDLHPFVGIWLNTNDATRGIVRIMLAIKGGDLTAHVFGACDPSPRDWGEVKAEAIYANSISSREGMAFTARYDFGFMETHLQANLNQGLLVVGGFNTFKDGSARSDYFSREFFHRESQESRIENQKIRHQTSDIRHQTKKSAFRLPPSAFRRSAIRHPLLGTWVNTNHAARGITKVILATRDGTVTVQVFGACDSSPCDWGEIKGAVFADSVSAWVGANFSAFYDFGFMEAHLQGYIRQGVLVVMSFNRFKDGSGRSNYVSKEFFYRLE